MFEKGVVKRRGSAVRREQIAVAAAKLIVKLGGEHVTIKNISSEIGISEAAIYRHFTNKRAIYSYMIGYAEKVLLADLSSEKGRDASVTADVDILVKRHLSNVVRRRGIFFQIFTEVISMGDEQLNKEAFRAINHYVAHIGQLIRACYSSCYFKRDCDPFSSACIFYSLLQFLVNTWILSGYSFNLENRFNHIWFKCGIAQQSR